ncbi:hypothetical protein A3B05_00180 [Candidatus Giovannonibacteria bacterium RIFCSPLOWO2_01_FULL_43_160]|uniref:Uncharacterized protein n=2 Tax=Candidatus Giovannoniibacteriota TaxID=1752738 RepID=A0A0G1LVT4_9BACT|nr:MAG: hypothetical protein UV72_C0001G0038 [Candidatus Giovannonibacteria bacterium GW2011_GWB1_43_13]KKS99759.1 MAG: hypothetical protein UV75_C0002G0140 [Candidatus Giovannonibacteria bacterium GW2011_GWA1_43_15]KKT63844.1 MAG: hypothetical protein UW55_C0001G0137 [Candidatus Giovannonibacteria bacterium GW2011_GWA2_44_26]OGF58168.1 MAG: hypothetical protein A2652_02550 [Candidatus Giovannonibacteria bacterium RIFCSPHIGHO2_01_FULL_43_140]OGF70472.1 MAG: hypothetical protein A3C76_00135 [Can
MKGFGILEIVIAVSIISATIFSLSFVFIISSRLEEASLNKIRANFLAEEGLEATRFLRDQSWATNLGGLSIGTTYYLSFNAVNSVWSINTSNPGLIDNLFLRKVTAENVCRNDSYDIVSSCGTLDPDTKKINVSVEWLERGSTATISASTYLSDIFDN